MSATRIGQRQALGHNRVDLALTYHIFLWINESGKLTGSVARQALFVSDGYFQPWCPQAPVSNGQVDLDRSYDGFRA